MSDLSGPTLEGLNKRILDIQSRDLRAAMHQAVINDEDGAMAMEIARLTHSTYRHDSDYAPTSAYDAALSSELRAHDHIKTMLGSEGSKYLKRASSDIYGQRLMGNLNEVTPSLGNKVADFVLGKKPLSMEDSSADFRFGARTLGRGINAVKRYFTEG